jgi:hypothetical protein
MDSTDTQSLTDDIAHLVSIAVEDFGRDLTRPRFDDLILGLFENVRGLETLPRKCSRQYLRLLWLRYQQTILAGTPGH